MAVYGVLGDIHGNQEALLAVLGFLRDRGVHRLACLGDIVGFGADPNGCVSLVQSCAAKTVVGNHDLISIRRLGFDRCANKAAYALRQTRRTLSAESAAFLISLRSRTVLEGQFLLVHAGIQDVEQYVRTEQEVRENAEHLAAAFPGVRICFFGHTHEQRLYEVGAGVVWERDRDAPFSLDPERTYFINPGSVDASRKRERKLAECAILDSSRNTVEFHRLPYDHEQAERKAVARGYRMGRVTARLYSLRRRMKDRLVRGG